MKLIANTVPTTLVTIMADVANYYCIMLHWDLIALANRAIMEISVKIVKEYNYSLIIYFVLIFSQTKNNLDDKCLTNPCLNSGTCQPLKNGTNYSCLCSQYFTGANCQQCIL